MEQPPIGYLVIPYPQLGVTYGTFDTEQEAVKFAQQLVHAEVYPLYKPALH
jgi:hypothetical protein